MNETALQKWSFRQMKHQRHGRMSIIKALRIIGLPAERYAHQASDRWRIQARRACGKQYGKTTFWERNAHCLQDIAEEMKRAFHAHLKEVKHDFTENHEEAALLIEAYTKAKAMFRRYGVEV